MNKIEEIEKEAKKIISESNNLINNSLNCDFRFEQGRINAANQILNIIKSDCENEFYERFVLIRGIEELCEECSGSGIKMYPSTAQWSGDIGGAAITKGICDKCWGSGDKNNPWLNLKSLNQKICDECKEKLKVRK